MSYIKNFLANIAGQLSVENRFLVGTPDELNVLLDRVQQSSMPAVCFVPPVFTANRKGQGFNITADFTVNLLFLRAIPNSSMDGATDTEIYPQVEAMWTLATEFALLVQQSEQYRKAGNKEILYETADILEKFDSYLAGQQLTFTAKLLVDWDYCIGNLREIVLTEAGNNVLVE